MKKYILLHCYHCDSYIQLHLITTNIMFSFRGTISTFSVNYLLQVG